MFGEPYPAPRYEHTREPRGDGARNIFQARSGSLSYLSQRQPTTHDYDDGDGVGDVGVLAVVGGEFDVAPWRCCRWALQCARSSRDDAVSWRLAPPTVNVVYLYELWW